MVKQWSHTRFSSKSGVQDLLKLVIYTFARNQISKTTLSQRTSKEPKRNSNQLSQKGKPRGLTQPQRAPREVLRKEEPSRGDREGRNEQKVTKACPPRLYIARIGSVHHKET